MSCRQSRQSYSGMKHVSKFSTFQDLTQISSDGESLEGSEMTEVKGSMGGGGLVPPVDWTYPVTHLDVKDFLHQGSHYGFDEDEEDDDDIDSYYMEVTPIDMTERLKEVNRALAEDETPVDFNRVTKLRFKDVIAEYQSLHDSDSDDGYGDSSEIMFDVEDEGDILETPESSGPQFDSPKDDQSSANERLRPSQEEIDELEAKFQEKTFDICQTSDAQSPFHASSSSQTPIKSILAPSTNELESSSDEDIPEEVSSDNVAVNSLPSGTRHPQTDPSNRRSSSPSESQITCDYEDDDVFEVDSDISEDLEILPTVADKTSEEEKNSKSDFDVSLGVSDSKRSENRHKEISQILDVSDLDFEHCNSKVDVKPESSFSRNLAKRESSNNDSKKNDSYCVVDNKSDSAFIKSVADKSCSENKRFNQNNDSRLNSKESSKEKSKKSTIFSSENKENSLRNKVKLNKQDGDSTSPHVPAIKPSLSPYEISSPAIKDSRGKKKTASSKSPPKKSDPRINRPRLNALNSTPTPVQNTRSNREVRARRGSPIPRRSAPMKPSEKKPIKAIHNVSLSNLNEPYTNEQRLTRPQSGPPSQSRVRKAASTSDLCRSSSEDQEKINEVVFEKWLQQKNRAAAVAKRQLEEAKAADIEAANSRLQERKQLAEEAFQRWLKRKRDQLRMEKRMRLQQKKLDQQTNYARTRLQCEEAYKEWCKRKNDEINARRSVGGRASGPSSGVRSRSLERTWIQEKTRKLYNAYLSK